MNNDFIKSWTKTIRNHCDLIDRQVEQSMKPSETGEQLDYVLTRLDKIQQRLHSIQAKPGRNKSYAFEVQNAEREIKEIRRDIKNWQTDGIKPWILEELGKQDG